MMKEDFRRAIVLLLGMASDAELSDHPSGDIAVKLLDGETFRIEVKDWDGELPPQTVKRIVGRKLVETPID